MGQKSLSVTKGFPNIAVWTGLEPATPCVTGMYSNQLNYQTSALLRWQRYNRFPFTQAFFEKKFNKTQPYYPKFCFSTKYVIKIFSKLSFTFTGMYFIRF